MARTTPMREKPSMPKKSLNAIIVKQKTREEEKADRIERLKKARDVYTQLSRATVSRKSPVEDDEKKSKVQGQGVAVPPTTAVIPILPPEAPSIKKDAPRPKRVNPPMKPLPQSHAPTTILRVAPSAQPIAPTQTTLSKTRAILHVLNQQQSGNNNSFQPMASSLEMITSNKGIDRNAFAYPGRPSSMMRAKQRDFGRPSLLPLGINVFDPKASETEKQKVAEFFKGLTPHKINKKNPSTLSLVELNAKNLEESMPESEVRSTRRVGRGVRFIEDIVEQRESAGDEVLQQRQPFTLPPPSAQFHSAEPIVPMSILKTRSTKKSPPPPMPERALLTLRQEQHDDVKETPRRSMSLRNNAGKMEDVKKNVVSIATKFDPIIDETPRRHSSIARPVTLFSGEKEMSKSSEKTERPSPILDQCSSSKSSTEKTESTKTASHKTLESLVGLSFDSVPTTAIENAINHLTMVLKARGDLSRQFIRKDVDNEMDITEENDNHAELMAHQEVMMINERGMDRRQSGRIRQRDPVSKFLSTNQPSPFISLATRHAPSPFVPTRSSPGRDIPQTIRCRLRFSPILRELNISEL